MAVLESQAFVGYPRPATPGDNSVNASFFSELKAEGGNLLAEAKTFDALYQLVRQTIAYYITERYHTIFGC
jgi:hypothetical protein